MNDVVTFLNENPVQYLATVGRDGKATIVKGQYGEATNPIFEVFYLKDAHAVIADFSGNPPKEYNL